ncbi:hypothetical protein ZWY2020_041181 [Hordeum vulgare]|nr:hypothetical protein ZWY2020_041181 [Hordeum vulgare]
MPHLRCSPSLQLVCPARSCPTPSQAAAAAASAPSSPPRSPPPATAATARFPKLPLPHKNNDFPPTATLLRHAGTAPASPEAPRLNSVPVLFDAQASDITGLFDGKPEDKVGMEAFEGLMRCHKLKLERDESSWRRVSGLDISAEAEKEHGKIKSFEEEELDAFQRVKRELLRDVPYFAHNR